MIKQRSDARVLDSLHTKVFGHSAESWPAFVLIDPALRNPLNEDSEFASRWKEVPRQVIRVPGWPDEKLPYLLPLAGRSLHDISVALRFAYEETLGNYDDERGHGRSLCAWLVPGNTDLKRLGSCMAQRAVAFPPHQSAAVVFRYWDPRLSADIPRVVSHGTWQSHLGRLGLRRWISFIRGSDDVEIADLPEAQSETPDTAGTLTWHLDSKQWRDLEALSWRNRLIQCSANWELKAPQKPDWLERIAHRALAHGLSEESDILRFAHCVLTLHPQFDSHPEVIEAISSVTRTGQAGFAEIVGNWSEDFVAELESGNWLEPAIAAIEKTHELT